MAHEPQLQEAARKLMRALGPKIVAEIVRQYHGLVEEHRRAVMAEAGKAFFK